MTIERSHGKARPTLPRSSDLALVPARDDKRDHHGRFGAGNQGGRGRGWKQATAKMLGCDVDDPIAKVVAEDAWKLFSACIKEMPNDGPTVRGLVATKARHEALSAFWTGHAVTVGITTEEGREADDRALKHGQRAERLAVTALDIATKMAARAPADPRELPPGFTWDPEPEPTASKPAPVPVTAVETTREDDRSDEP